MINKLDYVKADIEPDFSEIPMKYAQKFAHKFSYTSVSPIAVVKLREMGRLRNGKGLSMQDQEIAEFLYRNTFATAKQLMDYYEITNKEEFLGRLNYLVTSHVLNMFTLQRLHKELPQEQDLKFLKGMLINQWLKTRLRLYH